MQLLIFLLKVLTIFALSAFGATAIRDGWRMLDLSQVRVVVESGYISIGGGIGELGMGILVLSGAWFLLWRWFMRR